MTKRMLISVDEEESRVAIINSRRLENLEIEANGGEGRRGNIYKGVVHKVEPSLQAAFIDFGEEKQGFLPIRSPSSPMARGHNGKTPRHQPASQREARTDGPGCEG